MCMYLRSLCLLSLYSFLVIPGVTANKQTFQLLSVNLQTAWSHFVSELYQAIHGSLKNKIKILNFQDYIKANIYYFCGKTLNLQIYSHIDFVIMPGRKKRQTGKFSFYKSSSQTNSEHPIFPQANTRKFLTVKLISDSRSFSIKKKKTLSLSKKYKQLKVFLSCNSQNLALNKSREIQRQCNVPKVLSGVPLLDLL